MNSSGTGSGSSQFYEGSSQCSRKPTESSVRYDSREPEAVTFTSEKLDGFDQERVPRKMTDTAPLRQVERVSLGCINGSSSNPESNANGGNNRTRVIRRNIGGCCWPSLRAIASSPRSWWDAAQSSVKSIFDRFQSWPEENPNGPTWVVRIKSEYVTKRGEVILDMTDLEFRSEKAAEKYVMDWNQRFQEKSLDFPYNIYVFVKNQQPEEADVNGMDFIM